MTEKPIKLDDSNDFGFTIVGENEVSSSEVEDLKNRLKEVKKMFMPLLVNLNKNPEKEMIKWPNRKKILDEQIVRLDQLTNTE